VISHQVTALRIEREGWSVIRDSEADLFVQRGDAAGWQSLRELLKCQQRLSVRIPEWATLPVTLPWHPTTRAELRAMLNDASPLDPSKLAWTEPHAREDGSASTILVRRDFLDEHVGSLEQSLAIMPQVILEPSGKRLNYRLPSERRRNTVTAAIVGGSLAVSLAALAIAWVEAKPTPALPADLSMASLPQTPSIAATLLKLDLGRLSSAQLSAVSSDRSGVITVEVVTNDLAALQEELRGRAAESSYRMAASDVTPAGAARLTFSPAAAVIVPSARLAPVLTAASEPQALAIVAQQLHTVARARGARLRLVESVGSRPGQLEFSVDLTGTEAAVLAVAQDAESGAPPKRFREWRLEGDAAGLRLTGTLMVPWMAAQ
jgi:hypothetical protein